MRKLAQSKQDQTALSANKRIAHILETLALVSVLLAALALAGTSLFYTARINSEQYQILQIDLLKENAFINAAIVLLGIAALALTGKIRVTKRFNVVAGTIALTMLFVFGVVWVLAVKAMAESDGDVLIQIAERIIAGDFASVATSGEYLHYYLVRFPYQIGLLSCLEVLVRVFGSTGALTYARLINVGLLLSAYAALLLMTQRLFHKDNVTFVTLLLLCVNLQPLFSCTFVYGLIPALALDIWALYFVVRYMQTGRKRNMIPSVVLLAIATYLRSNTWIVTAAIAGVLLIHALRQKKIAPLLITIAMIAACLPLPRMAQAIYEKRLDTSFGEGYPKSYWMAMSLQTGWKATGWHVKAYQLSMEQLYGEDVDAIGEHARRDIRAGVSALLKEPTALPNYLLEKLVSQWDEQTFMSIWISESVLAYAEPMPLAQAVYSDTFDSIYRFIEGKLLKVVYFGFLLSTVLLFRRRTTEQLLLPIIVFGGLLFHLLFEAKSQYVLEYLPLLWPLAAYGSLALGSIDKQRQTLTAEAIPEANAEGTKQAGNK